MIQLDALNGAAGADFVAALEGVFEHAPWVAERTAPAAPFPTVAALHDALMATVERASPREIAAFLNAHPELAARTPPPGLTTESTAEQTGLSMSAAPGAADLPALNRAYRDRFGIPFIICVARHTPENILRTLTARLAADPADEQATALAEIRHITRLRLVARVIGAGMPPTGGHLSTHVLDIGLGIPAAGLSVTLLQEGRAIATVVTDREGRTAGLLAAGPLRQGHYTLLFGTAAYFAARQQETLYPAIPVPFVITHSEGKYHIPLLLSPFSYSTYRGS